MLFLSNKIKKHLSATETCKETYRLCKNPDQDIITNVGVALQHIDGNLNKKSETNNETSSNKRSLIIIGVFITISIITLSIASFFII